MIRHAIRPVILFVLLAALLAHAGCQARAATSAEAPPRAYPVSRPPPGMTLSAVLSGKMYSRAGLSFSGGSFSEQRVFAQGSILVRHPGGNLLFDAGFGRNVDQHFKTVPWLMQKSTRYDKLEPVGTQLAQVGLDPKSLKAVILTHAHWDHVSGLEDLKGVPVWVDQAELDFVRTGEDQTVLARQLGTADYQVYAFRDGPYLGFPSSYDVFSDGSVVLVPAPGHTPGSILAFISTPDGKHYALVGDLVWQLEGIEQIAPKPWLVRQRVDEDPDATFAMIERVHALQRALPGLIVVPAHDYRTWQSLPKLTRW